MKCPIEQLFFISLLVLLPACCRYVDWGKRNVYQGIEVCDESANVRRYLRSVSIYSQFSTCAMFDVLWLSDAVRTTYACVNSARLGKDEEHARAFLWRQLEENKHYITFYVLSLYDVPLDGANATWAVVLKINNNEYIPADIKAIELAPEYRSFLACELSRFKTAYEVTFDARAVEGQPLIDQSTRQIILELRSVKKRARLIWYISSDGRVVSPYCIPYDEPDTLQDWPGTCEGGCQ